MFFLDLDPFDRDAPQGADNGYVSRECFCFCCKRNFKVFGWGNFACRNIICGMEIGAQTPDLQYYPLAGNTNLNNVEAE